MTLWSDQRAKTIRRPTRQSDGAEGFQRYCCSRRAVAAAVAEFGHSATLSAMSLCVSICLSITSAVQAQDDWPVFYSAEKGPAHLLISREAQTLAAYTNSIPLWNRELLTPRAKINFVEINELGKNGGLRVLEVRFSLKDIYYTNMLMIIEEVKQGQFLPIYVQVYNRNVRVPSASVITNDQEKLIVNTGMDYEGTGHFHDHYKVTISLNHDPLIVGSND